MEKKKKHWMKTFILACFLLIILYLLLKDDYKEILSALQNLQLLDIILLILLSALPYMINGMILTKLCRMKEPSYTWKDGFVNGWVALFLMNISASAVAKGAQLILMKAKKISYDHGFGILLLDQMLYQISYAIFSICIFLLSLPYFSSQFPKELAFAWAGIMISLLPIFAMLFLFLYPKLPMYLIKILHFFIQHFHLKIKEDILLEKLLQYTQAIQESFPTSHHDQREACFIILWQSLRLCFRHILPFFIAKALSFPLTPHDFIIYFMASVWIDLILSSLPVYGKHGVAESSFVLIFTPLTGSINAASMMLIWRILTFYVNTLIGGFFGMLCKDISLRDLKEYPPQIFHK